MGFIRPLKENEIAVAEEFTALPALAVVMIGISLFAVLLTDANQGFNQQQEDIEAVQQLEYILSRFTSPQCPFVDSQGLIDLYLINQSASNQYIQSLQDDLLSSSINFSIKISYNNISCFFPNSPSEDHWNRLSYSKQVLIRENTLMISPGILTIIMWTC